MPCDASELAAFAGLASELPPSRPPRGFSPAAPLAAVMASPNAPWSIGLPIPSVLRALAKPVPAAPASMPLAAAPPSQLATASAGTAPAMPPMRALVES